MGRSEKEIDNKKNGANICRKKPNFLGVDIQ
jgi:hypothetical protein